MCHHVATQRPRLSVTAGGMPWEPGATRSAGRFEVDARAVEVSVPHGQDAELSKEDRLAHEVDADAAQRSGGNSEFAIGVCEAAVRIAPAPRGRPGLEREQVVAGCGRPRVVTTLFRLGENVRCAPRISVQRIQEPGQRKQVRILAPPRWLGTRRTPDVVRFDRCPCPGERDRVRGPTPRSGHRRQIRRPRTAPLPVSRAMRASVPHAHARPGRETRLLDGASRQEGGGSGSDAPRRHPLPCRAVPRRRVGRAPRSRPSARWPLPRRPESGPRCRPCSPEGRVRVAEAIRRPPARGTRWWRGRRRRNGSGIPPDLRPASCQQWRV